MLYPFLYRAGQWEINDFLNKYGLITSLPIFYLYKVKDERAYLWQLHHALL